MGGSLEPPILFCGTSFTIPFLFNRVRILRVFSWRREAARPTGPALCTAFAIAGPLEKRQVRDMNKNGFTLIELAIVVMIIGIIAAIAIPNFDRMASQGREAAVRANCHTVQLAAEDFAVQNGGVYAADVSSDATPAGSTLIGMLPGGLPLANPFTKATTEPVDGAAANVGSTGYAPIVQNGTRVGYTINGIGRHNGANVILLSSGQ